MPIELDLMWLQPILISTWICISRACVLWIWRLLWVLPAARSVHAENGVKSAVASAFASGKPHLVEVEIEGKRSPEHSK